MVKVRVKQTFMGKKLFQPGEEIDVTKEFCRRRAHLVEQIGKEPIRPPETQETGPEEIKTGVTAHYICPICDKRCKSKSGLSSHMRTHEKE